MISRILMDADATEGGSAETVTTTTQAKAEPTTLAVPIAEWRAAQEKLATYQKAESDKAEATRLDAEKKLIEKGQWEKVVADRDVAIAEREASIKAEKAAYATLEKETAATFVGKELAVSLPADQLVPGASAQLIRLWKDDFTAKRIGGEWVVQSIDGRAVADVVKERLTSAEYAHFVKAGNRGGVGADGTRAAANNQQQIEAPKNLGEAIARAWVDRQTTAATNYGTPRGFHGPVQKN